MTMLDLLYFFLNFWLLLSKIYQHQFYNQVLVFDFAYTLSIKYHQNHNILSIDDNPLQLSTNDIGASTTIEHNKPLVKCKVQSLTFDALLDACSTGPEGYIVNYIHPDTVHKIKTHQTSVKKPIIKKCNCVRASTCTGAGCFETSTCITLNIHLFDEVEEIEINNVNFRVSKGIPYDIIIGNYTFRDFDLSNEFNMLCWDNIRI